MVGKIVGVKMGGVFERLEGLLRERYKGWEGELQFKGSGERLRRLSGEMCWSREVVEEEVLKCLQAVFRDEYSEMLVCRGVDVWTLCPHHLLPANFKVSIGYIPCGQVLGLSKFARIAVTLGKMPTMQEQYSRDLADVFWNNLRPEGLGVYVVGRHGCMGCRGVNQDIEVVTSTLRGSFKETHEVREEFYNLCRK